MTSLLEKAKAGVLTNEDSEALEHYRHIGKLLEFNEIAGSAFAGVNSTSHSG
jgi:hypothetical protein